MFSNLSRLFSKKSSKKQKNKHQNSSLRFGENQRFTKTPLFNVLLLVTIGLGISGAFRFLEWRRINANTQIQLNDSENSTDSRITKIEEKRKPVEIFQGEVFETGTRLREIGALGFAVCLSILDEARTRKQIPGSIEALVRAVVSRNLMPPGLLVQNGEISSATSRIHIRYQPSPLSIEFISIPENMKSGPALMLRFPLSSDGKHITYFQAAKLENINLPQAFSPASEVIRSGWTLEVWRGSEVTGRTEDFARLLTAEQELLITNTRKNGDPSGR